MGGGGISIPEQKFDPSITAYYNYMIEHQKTINTETERQRTQDLADTEAVKSTGKAGYNAYLSNINNQYKAGLIDNVAAEKQLQNYAEKYKLGSGFSQNDINVLNLQYTENALPNLQKLAGQTYKDILGREAKTEELERYADLFKTGQYKLTDLTNSIKGSQEYQNKFNDNYLSNYYDTMYGKQNTETVDGYEKKTGKRTFNYDTGLDPTFAGDIGKASGVSFASMPSSVTGTPAEIQQFQDAQRQKRDFMYNAGLTNLQGQIDKDIQKIKDAGTQATARIGTQGQLLSNLTAGFWN
jgi:hypothetical protein